MNLWSVSLAAIKTGGGVLDNNSMTLAAKEVALVLFGLVVLAVALIVWVGFIRKRKRVSYSSGRRHHRHHRHHHAREGAEEAGASTEEAGEAETKEPKREASPSGKRRHVKFRRRFPTLAQTGGLPPKRPFPDESTSETGSSTPN